MRLKFMPVMETLATTENQRSSHIGTCFDTERPVAFETRPTRAVTVKWKPVRVVAAMQRKRLLIDSTDESNQLLIITVILNDEI
jgi:hypothetical protein